MPNDRLGAGSGSAALRLEGPAGGRCWLEASPCGDRWEHRLFVRAKDAALPLVELCSVESLPDIAWPESPPIQQLVLEELPESGPTLLGVGMAGSGHWSLSIHCDNSLGLVFDVACRVGSELPSWLGSSYVRPSRAAGTSAPSAAQATGQLVPLTGCRLEVASDAATACLRLAAAIEHAAPRETLRWSYCFRPTGWSAP